MIGMQMPGELDLPKIYLSDFVMSEFLGWPLNSEHYIVCKVNVVGKRKIDLSQEASRGAHFEAELQITAVQAMDIEPVDMSKLESDNWKKIKAAVHDNRTN